MRYPTFLPEGGRIHFVAPSFGCNIDPYKTAFENALVKFHDLGYQTVLGPNCFLGKGIGISNAPKKCADELVMAMLTDRSDAVISCGGGELMCEILPYINWQTLREAPAKWFMGFSDNTNFPFLSATLLDTAAIYGPCAPTFGMEPWHPIVQDALDLLSGNIHDIGTYPAWEIEGLKDEDHPLEPINATVPTVYRYYPENERTAVFEGRLLGGCLDILITLLGTRFDKVKEFNETYRRDGVVWYLEACDLNVFSIRRALWQMKNAGWFECARGFLIGRPLHYHEDIMGLDQYRAVTDIIGDLGVPIIMDADLGHLPPSMPMICGGYGKVTANENKLNIHYVLR